jgi:thiaminase (transcriptional activator TenA)
MSLTERLYEAARPIWDAQLEHPFVKGIGDGSLPPETFKRWVLQDYRYLKEFSRIFAWAVAKAQRLESMGWYAQVLNMTLNTEMALHRSYAARFEITPEELEATVMWPTTRAYTDFLVRTAADGDMSELLAALLPCAWGYLHIGQALAEAHPGGPAVPGLDRAVRLRRVRRGRGLAPGRAGPGSPGRLPEKEERLREIFLLSSRYELRFWDMCWEWRELVGTF